MADPVAEHNARNGERLARVPDGPTPVVARSAYGSVCGTLRVPIRVRDLEMPIHM
jgi:hypothetical protein